MIALTVNGAPVSIDADPQTPLLWALRDNLNLTGVKYGCGKALCGACTVHVDGEPTRSCALALGDAAGRAVVTIEGVSGRTAQAVLDAWRALDVVQCGYCQSGQIMGAIALLSANPKPSDSDIDAAMDGNICRCGAYPRIRAAIARAARSLG